MDDENAGLVSEICRTLLIATIMHSARTTSYTCMLSELKGGFRRPSGETQSSVPIGNAPLIDLIYLKYEQQEMPTHK